MQPMKDSKVPERLTEIPPQIYGAGIAAVLGMLIVVYAKEETKLSRVIMEGASCGLLCWAAGSGLGAAGLDAGLALLLGGIIGSVGSTTIRALILKAVGKKLDS